MLILSGGDLVLTDRIVSRGCLLVEGGRIVEIRDRPVAGSPADTRIDLAGSLVVPGFIDVHVHGVAGRDTLDGPDAVRAIAARLPRYGVTAFCPTTVACPPVALRTLLSAVAAARSQPAPGSARVLPAHLESNFISPEYRGAQPAACLRLPPPAGHEARGSNQAPATSRQPTSFSGAEILGEIERCRPDVGIVTLAPELEAAVPLIRRLTGQGIRVSVGHSAASYETALEAIAAGARHATHLFNRMPPLGHRRPGLAGAILASGDIAAEIICDGYHVHPSMVGVAIAAKGCERVMAITDGTSGAGLPAGARATLGGQSIVVGEGVALLDDGTIAGSVCTMDRAFGTLVGKVGLSPSEAALVCSTTPARELGLAGHGVIAAGAVADLVVLTSRFEVLWTFVGGEPAYRKQAAEDRGL